MLCLDRVLPGTAPAVRQSPVACVPSIQVQARDDAQTKEHALHPDEKIFVALRQPYADPLALMALYAGIAIEQSAQETDVKIRRCAVHRVRHGFATRSQPQGIGQSFDCAQLHSVLAAAGDGMPSAKIRSMR